MHGKEAASSLPAAEGGGAWDPPFRAAVSADMAASSTGVGLRAGAQAVVRVQSSKTAGAKG